MATVTHVCALNYVAKMLDEDPELLEAIVYNDDHLTHGAIISVYTGSDQTITALTDEGIDELKDLLRDARVTTETWHAFLNDFVDDEDLVARIKAQSPRQQPAGYTEAVDRLVQRLDSEIGLERVQGALGQHLVGEPTMMATRQRQPSRIGNQVISTHTDLLRSIDPKGSVVKKLEAS